ncbi:RpiB/LacA/LacB family sugar-phosphate isomerase [Alicyclobacillus fastidiosus]|uniref:RpiB/LacA/LacB family sugar-phosphate isomerase n=1 Tax=Alicyclobacillus fastidiosus TaxID=392011 RepID=UPI0032AFA10C
MLIEDLQKRGLDVRDFGCFDESPVDYPDIGFAVAKAVQEGTLDRGILVCGTGIGMCIAANKVHGVSAALCHDVYSAGKARTSNNAQIITLGARVVGPELAKIIVERFLESDFSGGNSARKVGKITSFEDSAV